MNIMSKLTVGDIAIVEEMSGLSIGTMGDEDKPKGKMLAAMVYAIKRKQDKEFTFQDALEMNFDEVSKFLGLSDEEEPDDPKAD
jgi:hypothetical protein